jgi:glycosyltransferase involved in cell wall biosynthesis
VKVLHLCAGNLFGGIERIVLTCADCRALDPSTDASFAVCFEGRLSQQLRATGASCTVLGDVRASRPHTVLRARRRLAHLLETTRPDAAVCHSCWTFGLAAPVLERHGVAAVPWIHDRLSGRTWVERWASRSEPARVLANSRFTEASVAAVFPRAATHVLYAPVPARPAGTAAVRQALRTELDADEVTCVVLIASRFEPWKGHRVLVEALSSIPSGWQLWIAGEPQKTDEHSYASGLRALAAAAGVQDRVRFLGHRDDVSAVMSAADVLCQPNTAPEPFGITFVEALYAGRPVITTRFGGAAEILTDDCGILTPPADHQAITAALRCLIADPARRRALGAAGPARARVLCDPAVRLGELSHLLAEASVACH